MILMFHSAAIVVRMLRPLCRAENIDKSAGHSPPSSIIQPEQLQESTGRAVVMLQLHKTLSNLFYYSYWKKQHVYCMNDMMVNFHGF